MNPGRVKEKSAPGRQNRLCKGPEAGIAWQVQQSQQAWLEKDECEGEGWKMKPWEGRGGRGPNRAKPQRPPNAPWPCLE